MARLVEGAGVQLACEERGAGRPVLLVHGMAADAAALEPLARDLAGGARVIAYDRRGYGASGAPQPFQATTVEEQAQDAAALLGALGVGQALGVGIGFGALVVLDLAKRHGALVGGAVLVDPPLLAFVAQATEALAAERERIAVAVRARGPAAGVDAWLGDGPPEGRRSRARAAHRAFFADYAGQATWPVTRAELRALDIPAVVVTGPETPATVAAAADALAALLPAARRATGGDVAGAVRALLAQPQRRN